MALGPRLDLRQSQSLVMTPQLQQAIKLLALSNLEIEAFIGENLETNPLLEAGELAAERPSADELVAEDPRPEPTADELIARGAGEADAPLDIDPASLDRDRDTGDWAPLAAAGATRPRGSTNAAGPRRRSRSTSMDRSARPPATRKCCSSHAT